MPSTTYKSGPLHIKPLLLHVRFEQGRGQGGVPNSFIALYPGVIDGEQAFQVDTIVKLAVVHMRAVCADPVMHGQDLMPGDDSEYELHHAAGGKITSLDKLRFEAREDGFIVSDLVLTWGTPGRKLLAMVADEHTET